MLARSTNFKKCAGLGSRSEMCRLSQICWADQTWKCRECRLLLATADVQWKVLTQ